MHVLTFDFVKSVVVSEINPKIKAARCMSDKLLLHVEGVGLQEYLSRINEYENELQFEARRKHAKSNKFLTEELLRPVDNAFHARGGSRNYKFKSGAKEDDLIKKLVNIKSNSSLSEYIEQEWFHRFVTDPNGLIFTEVVEVEQSEGEEEIEIEQNLEPTYKSIHSIRDYKQSGLFVDWVIFEPHEIEIDNEYPKDENKHKKSFWAVDELYYYLYIIKEKDLTLIRKVDNSFGKVPAILCSNIHDSITGWKKSPIDSQVELLDKYLVSNSVLSISEFFHNYLREWTYIDKCNKCHGSGRVADAQSREVDCGACDGTGQANRKDVTDVIKLKIPDADGIKIDPPAGYLYAPIDAWDAQINSVDRTKDMAFFSQWGTLIEKGSKSETATGRFIDAQPVNNRLNKYSTSIEKAHSALANLIGQYYFPETFEVAIIQYGRRYMIETPDQIWDKYLKAKKDNAPTSTLDLLLFQFYESEFRENEQHFMYETKKAKLEPFVHWDINTVSKLNVAPEDYYKKLYFSDWVHTLEVAYIIKTDIKKLNEELTAFVSNKIPQVAESAIEPIKIEDEKV